MVYLFLLLLAVGVGCYGTIIGAGGGFVLVPGVIVLADIAGFQGVATSSVAAVAIGVTGSRAYSREGLVGWDCVKWFALGSVPTALLASSLISNRLNQDAFNVVFVVLLLGLAIFVVLMPRQNDDSGALPARRLPLFGGGTLIGLVSGTFAVGGGLLTIPFFAWLQRMRPHRATATTQAATMMASAAGATGHIAVGNVVWRYVPVLVIGAIAGATLGAHWSGRLSPKAVVALIATGLVAASIPMIFEAAGRPLI